MRDISMHSFSSLRPGYIGFIYLALYCVTVTGFKESLVPFDASIVIVFKKPGSLGILGHTD